MPSQSDSAKHMHWYDWWTGALYLRQNENASVRDDMKKFWDRGRVLDKLWDLGVRRIISSSCSIATNIIYSLIVSSYVNQVAITSVFS